MAMFKIVLAVAALALLAGNARAQDSYKVVYQTTTVFNTTDCTGGSIFSSFVQVNDYSCEYSQCLLNGIPGQSVRMDCTYNFVDTSYSLGAPTSDQIALQTAKNFYLLSVQYSPLGSPSAPCSGLPSTGSLFPASSAPGLNQTLFGTCIGNSLGDSSILYNCTKGFLTMYTFNGLGCKDVNVTNTESCLGSSATLCATGAAAFVAPMMSFALLVISAIAMFAVSSRL